MEESALRLLVACGRCKTQYDATDHAAGSRFHCGCGELVEVPPRHPHDAAVVRCSSCGAAREPDGEACGFCLAKFTLRERDLHTICPGCMSRISDRGRFCHSCALPIAPQGTFGERSEHACPACGPERPLVRREIEKLGLLECPGCTGMWLGSDVFRLLEERAKREAVPAGRGHRPPPGTGPAPELQRGTFYRRCIFCGEVMHRRNYGRKSGIMIDTCTDHGIWFDSEELERSLAWIREGGLARAEEAAAEESRRQKRVREMQPIDPGAAYQPRQGRAPWLRLGEGLLEILYHIYT